MREDTNDALCQMVRQGLQMGEGGEMIIEKAWREYEKLVIPPGAPCIQRVESKRAFYAGAISLLSGIARGLDRAPGKEPTKADFSMMDSIQKELDQYITDLENGRA